MLTGTGAALFAVWAAVWYANASDQESYATYHRFVGTLPIWLYLIVRNLPCCIDYVCEPLEQLGTISLEAYLLQFHLLMTRQVPGVCW